MNILFLSQSEINLEQPGIYSDLLVSLRDRGHTISLICANSTVKKDKQEFISGLTYLKVAIGNQFGASMIKKGLIMLSLQGRLIRAIKRNFRKNSFDVVLYATPPITFAKVISFCKNYYKCKSYLLLKDIFPQNALDLGLLKRGGVKGFIYKYFKNLEKRLYTVSDRIGCMSKANLQYLVKHNPNCEYKSEIFPNSMIVRESISPNDNIVSKYFEKDKFTFVFGGNLGIPQGIVFLCSAIKACENLNAHFIIIGKGSEKNKIMDILKYAPNATIIDYLEPSEYNDVCNASDAGIISLDARFTIPNYPSRILSYMQNSKPVFAVTDTSTDIRDLVEKDANCGLWCLNGDLDAFVEKVNWFCNNAEAVKEMGRRGRAYFEKNFDVTKYVYKIENIYRETQGDV